MEERIIKIEQELEQLQNYFIDINKKIKKIMILNNESNIATTNTFNEQKASFDRMEEVIKKHQEYINRIINILEN